MGDDLNIIRRKDWANEQERSNITFTEWFQYASNDNELVCPDSDEPGFFEWKTHPGNTEDHIPSFEYSRWGYITAKNPDPFVIKKMLAIAEALNGKITGEDGGFYDEGLLKEVE